MIQQKVGKKDLLQCSFSLRSVKNDWTKITYISVPSVWTWRSHLARTFWTLYRYMKTVCPRHFVLMFCGTASLALFVACSYIFCQNQGFCSYKVVLECIYLSYISYYKRPCKTLLFLGSCWLDFLLLL